MALCGSLEQCSMQQRCRGADGLHNAHSTSSREDDNQTKERKNDAKWGPDASCLSMPFLNLAFLESYACQKRPQWLSSLWTSVPNMDRV